MIVLKNGRIVQGGTLLACVLRNDLAPVPVTLEADIRAEKELASMLAEGQAVRFGGHNGDEFRIIKSERIFGSAVQGEYTADFTRIIAVLSSMHNLCFARKSAVIMEDAQLTGIYRRCESTATVVNNDFACKRFYCFAGEAPSFHIMRALQDAGGVVRYKNNRLEFLSLYDLSRREPTKGAAYSGGTELETEYIERFDVPSYYSTTPSGAIIQGNLSKDRTREYAPLRDAGILNNMTKCLVRKRTIKMAMDQKICAGDIVVQAGINYVVMTAAHDCVEGLTKLWLGVVK